MLFAIGLTDFWFKGEFWGILLGTFNPDPQILLYRRMLGALALAARRSVL
jgi:hypothetical protein